MTSSFSFDRAAPYYDEAYSLPPHVHEEIVELLREQLRGRRRCLDLGAGTGRLSLPLAISPGIGLVAADTSLPMLRRLVEKRPAGLRLAPVVADATTLPFADGSFDAAVASLVLHLIPDWRAAVSELLRVLAGGGTLLVDAGGPVGIDRQLQDRLALEAGLKHLRPGLDDPEELDEVLAAAGARMTRLPPITYDRGRSIAQALATFDTNRYPITWQLGDVERRAALRRVGEWAATALGSLTEPRPFEASIRWRRYDFPDRS